MLRTLLTSPFLVVLIAFSTAIWQVFILRFLVDVLGGFYILVHALVAQTAPRDRIGQAIGTLQAIQMVCLALVPPVAGLFTDLRGRPIVRALDEGLNGRLRLGTPPVMPGTAQISTITQKGWTLRVYSKAAADRTVSLLWDQASSRSEVRVPSRARLSRCFPTAPACVDAYVELCRDLGIDVTSLSEAQSLAIREATVLVEMKRLVACVRAFATAYGDLSASS